MPKSADQKTLAAEMERQRLDVELDRELEATFPPATRSTRSAIKTEGADRPRHPY